MRKIFLPLVLMFFTCFLGLAGCADIYANMKISVLETEVVLYVGEGAGEGTDYPSSTTITATLTGRDDPNITNKLGVFFDDEIASASDWSYDENTGTVTITAKKDGTSNMYIKSLDNSIKVSSEAVKVTVVELVKSISVDSAQKVSVAIGQNLNLTELGNIDFFPKTTSQTELEFYFPTTVGGNISGNREAQGGKLRIEVEDGNYILKTSADANVELITILAKSKEVSGFSDVNLVKTFNILVYQGFDESDIKVKNISDDSTDFISSLKLVKNYSGETGDVIYNQKRLAVVIDRPNGSIIDTQNLKFSIENPSVKDLVEIKEEIETVNQFVATAIDSGQTSFDVVIRVGVYSGSQFVEYTQKKVKFDFTVVRVAENMTLSTDENSSEVNEQSFSLAEGGEPLLLNVFANNQYASGVFGSKIVAVLSAPSQTGIENPFYKIDLSQVKIKYSGQSSYSTLDKNTGGLEEFKNCIIIRNASGGLVGFGDSVESGKALYVSFDSDMLEGNTLVGFTLDFIANYQESEPTLIGQALCSVFESVGEISAPNDIVIEKGDEIEMVFEAEGDGIDGSQFIVELSRVGIAEYQTNGVLRFIIRGLEQGETTLTIRERNTHAKASFKITVVEVLNYAWLDVGESEKIASIVRDEDNPIYDDQSEENKDIFTLKQVVAEAGSFITLQVKTNPEKATITVQGVMPDGKKVVYSEKSGTISIRTTSLEENSVIRIEISGYEKDGINIVEKVVELEFELIPYLPINNFSWDSVVSKTEIDVSVYDLSSLSLDNQEAKGIGYVELKPYVQTSSSRDYEIEYRFTTSQYDDYVTLKLIDENDSSKGVRISANLGMLTEPISLRLYAHITGYGKMPGDIYCNITISKATQIESIQVPNYSDTEGIYLEAGAEDSSYSACEVRTTVAPNSAYDTSLSYVLYSKDGTINTYHALYSVNKNKISVQYFNGTDVDNVPLHMQIKNGVLVLSINEALEDTYYLRIMPNSMLNVGIDDERWEAKFSDTLVYKDLNIIIGKGTEVNPYRILTEQDLSAIRNKGVDKHYELMQDIELSQGWSIIDDTFTGSLTSHKYLEEGRSFVIQGFFFNVTSVKDTELNVGIFKEIGSSGRVKDIDIQYGESNINLTSSDSVNAVVRAGLLAGTSNSSNISNVSFYPNMDSKIKVIVGSNSNRSLFLGGLFGDNLGTIQNVNGTANIEIITNNNANLQMSVGGVVGVNYSVLKGAGTRPLIQSNITIIGSASSSSVGGIAGENGTVTIGTQTYTGTISFFDVLSNLNAVELNQVGGIVGLNSAGMVEKSVVTPFILAKNYVGGVAGDNRAVIKEAEVEFIYLTSRQSHTAIKGNDYVGGIAGKSTGNISLSYTTSYVSLTLVNKNINLGSGEFYGDILGSNYVGGLVGQAQDCLIQSSFVKAKIGVYNRTTKDLYAGGFVGNFVSSEAKYTIQYAYAITDLTVYGYSWERIGGFLGEFSGNGATVTECYSVLNGGEGFDFIDNQTQEDTTYRNNFAGKLSDTVLSKIYYADSSVSATTSANDGANVDDKGANKRTYQEMQKLGSDENTYFEWNNTKWAQYANTAGFNNELPILVKNYSNNEWLFNSDLSYLRVKHNSYLKESDNPLPTFWTYSYQENSEGGFDENLQMVVALENLSDSKSLSLTDLVSVLTGLIDLSNTRIKVESSNASIVSVQQKTSGFEEAALIFNNTGTVKISIYSLRNSAISVTFQICVIGGFNSYQLLDESGNALQKDIDEYVLSVVLKGNTSIFPTFTTSKDYNDNFGVVYFLTTLENGEGDVIAYFKEDADNVQWSDESDEKGENRVYIKINPNEAHWIYGNARQLNAIKMTAHLYLDLYFYNDLDELKAHTFIFSEDNVGDGYPTLTFKNEFSIKVFQGITGASLNRASASVENKEAVEVTLTISTDNTDFLLQDISQFVKIYKDGKLLSDEDVRNMLIWQSAEKDKDVSFKCYFEYEKIRLTEPVSERYTFKIYNENEELKKEIVLPIEWKPTKITRIDALHYLDRQTYTLDTGVSESTSKIGSGQAGVLKISVSKEYSDYDYIVVSSSQAGGDRISFMHLINPSGQTQLEISQQYSNYLADGSIRIDKRGSTEGIYYLSTLIASGVADGTLYTISIKAYKNGDPNSVFSDTKSLTSSFAPYAHMSLVSQFADNAVARGSLSDIKITGIAQNSTIVFTLNNIKSDSDLTNSILLDKKTSGIAKYEKQNGALSFNLSLYMGILSETLDKSGKFSITAEVTSIIGGAVVKTTSVLELYLVDYVVTKLAVENATGNVLDAVLQYGYTPLNITFETTLGTYEEAVANYTNATTGNVEVFRSEYNNLMTETIQSSITSINAWGFDNSWSMWYYNGRQISAFDTYVDFYVARMEAGGKGSLGVKGKREVSLNFSGQLARSYIIDTTTTEGYYSNNWSTDFSEVEGYLESAINLYWCDFTIAFKNSTTVEEPEQITTPQELVNMVANGHYILMNDITLTNWVPLTTKIGSLDGNGYVIYLENFQLATTNENGAKKSAMNVGLFESISTFTDGKTNAKESTRLTNLIIDVSRTTWTDLTDIATVNFGFIAGLNDGGIIYNCDIINTVTNQGLNQNATGYDDSWKNYYEKDSKRVALENNYVYASQVFSDLMSVATANENSTIVSTFIFTSSSIKGRATNVNIGGLAGLNNGYITNSRVGRVSDKIGKEDEKGKSTTTSYGINIFGGGSLGGLVGRNTGTVSSSYFANGSLVNFSSIINDKTITGGLVAYNAGNINTSYIEGIQKSSGLRSSGSGIYFSGTVGGFVHTNTGSIENCYSNIEIYSSLGVGGFVYSNSGADSSIKYSYSASTINSESEINGAFTGVDREINVLNSGLIENSYYLQDSLISFDEKEPASALGSKLFVQEDGQFLVGFVFGSGGIWEFRYMDTLPNMDTLPKLVQADTIAYSNREPDQSSQTALNYISAPGDQSNPYLIYNVATFNDVFGSTVENSKYVRLVSNIDFAGKGSQYSSSINFSGSLQGNGMILKDLVLLSESANVQYFGLFKELSGGVVSNFTLTVNQISATQSYAVGALAGKIADTSVNSIKILASNSESSISGYNITGGLAGVVTGASDTRIVNIESSVSVYTTYDVAVGEKEVYYSYSETDLQDKISYAGGVIGVVTLQSKFDTNKADPNIVNCSAYGNITINAEIVGGVFGLVDDKSVVSDSKFVLNNSNSSQSLAGTNIAGGLVGENRGMITYSYIAMSDTLQADSDKALSEYKDVNKQTGITNLFTGSPNVIGGLVGLNVGTSEYAQITTPIDRDGYNGCYYLRRVVEEQDTYYYYTLIDSDTSDIIVGETKCYQKQSEENNSGIIEYSYSRVEVLNSNAKVAGGVVGIAITNRFELQDGITALINTTSKKVYQTLGSLKTFATSFGEISAYMNNVYNTGAVSAQKTAGGLVGIMTAPINTAYEKGVLAILSSGNSSSVSGKIAGSILYDVRSDDNDDNDDNDDISDILFIDSSKTAIEYGVVATGVVATDTTSNLVGNSTNAYNGHLMTDTVGWTLTQIASEASKIKETFRQFQESNSEKWVFDDTLENNVFPRLIVGKTVDIQEISSVDDFFKYIKGGQGGSFRITQDLTFDLSKTEVKTKLKNLSSLIAPISGVIQGYGQEGARITITVLYGSEGSVDNEAVPFFGYVNRLSLSNIDFVFEEKAKSSDEKYFGLLAKEAKDSSFNNISLSNDYVITPNSNLGLGGIVGLSERCTYRNISVQVEFVNDTYAMKADGLNAGGVFGEGKTRNTVYNLDVNVTIQLKTSGAQDICLGGIAGNPKGHISITGERNNPLTVEGVLDIESEGKVYTGGVVGYADGSIGICKISDVVTHISYKQNASSDLYVGGMVGYSNRTTIENVNALAQMDIIGSENIFVGGIGGQFEADIIFSDIAIVAENTFTKCASEVDINITSNTDSGEVFAGGLFGVINNKVTVTGEKRGNLNEVNVYQNNFAGGKIEVSDSSSEGVLYLGGLFGKVYNSKDGLSYTSDLLLISSCASDVVLISKGFKNVYMGGITGYSAMPIYNSVNYGMLSATNTNGYIEENKTVVGGIAGHLERSIYSCLSMGAVLLSGMDGGSVQAIVGTGGDNYLGSKNYYSIDLTGRAQSNKEIGENITLNDLFKDGFFTGKIGGLTKKSGNLSDENSWICLPYIESLEELMSLYKDGVTNTQRNVWVTKISNATELDNAFADDSNPYKSIILTQDMELNNLDISNIGRILGNQNTVSTASSVFETIPTNCLISNLIIEGKPSAYVKVSPTSTQRSGYNGYYLRSGTVGNYTYTLITQSTSSIDVGVTECYRAERTLTVKQASVGDDLTYGMLARTNDGMISNCVVGSLPEYINNSATIATKSLGLDSRTVGQYDDVLTLNINASTNNNTKIYVGGLVGQNKGTVTNSWSYFDLNLNVTGSDVNACYVGGLVGYNTAEMDYCYALGKGNIISTVTHNMDENQTGFIGGVLGYTATTVSQLIGLMDFDSSVDVGGVLGGGIVGKGVIYARDMSRTSKVVTSEVVTSNAGGVGSENFTIKDLLDSKKDLETTFGLKKLVWGRDASLNYGLPTLTLGTTSQSLKEDIRYTGGSGTDPMQIANYALLEGVSNGVLTRDLTATKTIGSGEPFSGTLKGNGFVIFVDNISLLVNGSDSTYSVFNFQLSGSGVLDSIMIKINGSIETNKPVAIAPLLYKNVGGTVKNCAVFGSVEVEGGSGSVGGLVAEHEQGTIQKCWTDVKMQVKNGVYNVGGIAGKMGVDKKKKSLITTSFASASITLSDCTNSAVGGLVGKIIGVLPKTENGQPVYDVEGNVVYESSCEISSSYFSGITKHLDEVGEIESGTGEKSNYFGAIVGTFGDLKNTDSKYAINNLKISNIYFAGKLNSYYTTNSNIVVGYPNTEGGGYKEMFGTVYIQADQTVDFKNDWTKRGTATQLMALTGDLGDAFGYESIAEKPYLKNVTPTDRYDSTT